MTDPSSHVFPRSIAAPPPRAVKGEGVWITDADGKRYIDASGGAAVSCLGHSEPRVIAAIKRQIDDLPFAHTGFFTSQPAEDLADLLTAAAPGDLDHVYFVSGGSEAVETALKMARQYFLEVGQPQRHKFIARNQSYHGNTLGALAVGGNAWRREPYAPLLIDTDHIPECNLYRGPAQGESPEAYGQRVADALDAKTRELGPETVCAFVAETVVGATAGVLPPAPGYFQRIREICDRHGVLLILDEVMSGMGRTGTLFACEQDGVAPDLIAVAKGLGAGYQPIGAVLVSDRMYQAFAQGSGVFQHGHTYMGHPTACAAALAVQRVIRDDHLLDNVNARGRDLMDGLRARLGQNPHLGDIRGRGLFVGVELVADRDTKTPFDPALKLNARIKRRAMANGLICYPGGGSADGRAGDHVLLAPPFIVTADDVATIVDRLGRSIDEALEEIGA
ncbi:MAG: aspartate aminotransferase family protein [Rhodobacterales bacterium]|nr:aspartate aminotransferase family protein [Rhodobacterales bacterium]